MKHPDEPTAAEVTRDDTVVLQARIRELEAQIAWTDRQHELWYREREDLLREVRGLRADLTGRVLAPGHGVLIAMPYLSMGGAEAIVSQISRQLRKLGFRLFVLTTQPTLASQGDSSAWFRDSIETSYHLPCLLEDVSRWPEFIRSLIEQRNIEVIWQIGASYLYLLLPQILLACPNVAVVDLLFNTLGHTENYLAYRKYIDHVVVEHAGTRDWLVRHGVPQPEISIIPNGVDLARYRPKGRLDWQTGRPRAQGDEGLVIGFFGRLSDEKGADLFVDIATLLASSPMEFLVCGIGPLEADLRRKVLENGLAGRVHFLGFVPTPDYLPCCDAVIVCSRLDGRPNVVMESLAMGVPVVASRVGGIPDMLPEEQQHLLCEPGDVGAFAKAVRGLAEDPKKREAYPSSARRYAEEHFSVAGIGEAYAHLFHRLRRQRPRFKRLSRGLTAMAPAFHVGSHFRNAYLVLHVWRSGAWPEIRRLFDRAYYTRKHPIIRNLRLPALLHYIFWGFRMGSDPSTQFRTHYYLTTRPDVARAGLNPLLHYVAFGRAEAGQKRPTQPTAV